MATSRGPETRSLPELFGSLMGDITTLFRKEIQLARAETSEKISQTVTAIGLIMGGALLAIGALIVLLQALVVGLTNLGMQVSWASLLVGVVVGLIALLLFMKGTRDLKAENLRPERTIEAIKEDGRAIREQVR